MVLKTVFNTVNYSQQTEKDITSTYFFSGKIESVRLSLLGTSTILQLDDFTCVLCFNFKNTSNMIICIFLPTGSEERRVFGAGSIPIAILPSHHDMKYIAL